MNKYHIHLAVAYSAGFFQSMPRFGALELEYTSEDEIPENAREYYSRSLIHISEPPQLRHTPVATLCLNKKKKT
ncbi:hypothetical protein, partial [Sulfoacidibacillus thermotolerans]|uniref:hypothetical protein n=1 Tax=Sulfoacidibacillus thermotolerans TaxID=1765684 RepID=UPI001C62BC17